MKRIGLLLAMPLAAAGLFFGGCREAKKEKLPGTVLSAL